MRFFSLELSVVEDSRTVNHPLLQEQLSLVLHTAGICNLDESHCAYYSFQSPWIGSGVSTQTSSKADFFLNNWVWNRQKSCVVFQFENQSQLLKDGCVTFNYLKQKLKQTKFQV